MDNQQKDKEQKANQNESWAGIPKIVWAIGIGALLAFVAWCLRKFTYVNAGKRTFTKSKLRKIYGVNKTTFNKWVFYFCQNEDFDYAAYTKKRKLSEEEYNFIIETLGIPSKETRVMKKGEIVNPYPDDTSGGNLYRGVRNSRQLSAIISIEAYTKLNIFPPNISKRLSDNF
jgi:hypothetical protein